MKKRKKKKSKERGPRGSQTEPKQREKKKRGNKYKKKHLPVPWPRSLSWPCASWPLPSRFCSTPSRRRPSAPVRLPSISLALPTVWFHWPSPRFGWSVVAAPDADTFTGPSLPTSCDASCSRRAWSMRASPWACNFFSHHR